MKRKVLGLSVVLAFFGTVSQSQTLDAPAPAENLVVAPASSSVGSTDIIITVLATLLIWAAIAQNERAKND